MSQRQNATLVDYVSDYIRSTFSVRPDMIDTIAPKVKLAVVDLQKEDMLPETTIEFDSIDRKGEKRDKAGRLIYNFYRLPTDFRKMYDNGPNFGIVGGEKHYTFLDYSQYLRVMDSTEKHFYTIHRYHGEFGKRNRLIARPFPKDTDQIFISYYVNGVDTELGDIDEDYYMPIINHVASQMGLKSENEYRKDVNKIKSERNNPGGQGSYHDSFTKSKPRFFGKHRP